MSKQKRKLKKNQVAFEGKIYDINHPAYADLYEEKIATDQVYWDEDNQEWKSTLPTAYNIAPKWNPKLSKEENDKIYEDYYIKKNTPYESYEDRVRRGTGAFARPILEFGLEMSGAAGTYRFAQDPLKNLKGTANILSYTNLPGLIGHGIDYAMGKPFFNVTEEDLQGLGNTLDVAGLATLGAGTALKLAPKAVTSIPRMLGKIPDVNPNMGLRFTDQSIDASKALNKNTYPSILENPKELNTAKSYMDFSDDDLIKLEKYLDDVYDYNNLTEYEKWQLLDRETYYLKKNNISINDRINNNNILQQYKNDYTNEIKEYFNSPKFRERVNKQYGLEMDDQSLELLKNQLLKNLEKKPFIRPDEIDDELFAAFYLRRDNKGNISTRPKGHTYFSDVSAKNKNTAYHEFRHQLTNAEDESFLFPSQQEIEDNLIHKDLLEYDSDLNRVFKDGDTGRDYYMSPQEFIVRLDELKRDLSKVGYDYKTQDLTPEILKKYKGLTPKEAIEQVTGKNNVRFSELSEKEINTVHEILEKNPERTKDTNRLLNWFKPEFLINQINNKWGFVPASIGTGAAGYGIMQQPKQEYKTGGRLKYNNGGKVIVDGKEINIDSNEYRRMYESGNLMNVDKDGIPIRWSDEEAVVTAQMTDEERQKRKNAEMWKSGGYNIPSAQIQNSELSSISRTIPSAYNIEHLKGNAVNRLSDIYSSPGYKRKLENEILESKKLRSQSPYTSNYGEGLGKKLLYTDNDFRSAEEIIDERIRRVKNTPMYNMGIDDESYNDAAGVMSANLQSLYLPNTYYVNPKIKVRTNLYGNTPEDYRSTLVEELEHASHFPYGYFKNPDKYSVLNITPYAKKIFDENTPANRNPYGDRKYLKMYSENMAKKRAAENYLIDQGLLKPGENVDESHYKYLIDNFDDLPDNVQDIINMTNESKTLFNNTSNDINEIMIKLYQNDNSEKSKKELKEALKKKENYNKSIKNFINIMNKIAYNDEQSNDIQTAKYGGTLKYQGGGPVDPEEEKRLMQERLMRYIRGNNKNNSILDVRAPNEYGVSFGDRFNIQSGLSFDPMSGMPSGYGKIGVNTNTFNLGVEKRKGLGINASAFNLGYNSPKFNIDASYSNENNMPSFRGNVGYNNNGFNVGIGGNYSPYNKGISANLGYNKNGFNAGLNYDYSGQHSLSGNVGYGNDIYNIGLSGNAIPGESNIGLNATYNLGIRKPQKREEIFMGYNKPIKISLIKENNESDAQEAAGPPEMNYGGYINPDDPTLPLTPINLFSNYDMKYNNPYVEDKDAAMRGMMKARMAIDSELGRNPSAKRMTSISPKKYTFTGDEIFYNERENIPAGETGTHYMTGDNNIAFPIIQEGQDGNLFFNRYASPYDREAMRFETPEEAEYFGMNYKSIAPMMYEYKKGGKFGGLNRWFAEKWVDVKTGKPCGRQEGESRRSYPACRPSVRVNSKTPKTSSELSSAEKERFKRSKTSSQRINYQHKRNK